MSDRPEESQRAMLEDKLNKLSGEIDRSKQAYGAWRKKYEALHWILGLPAVALAALASATAFADSVPSLVVGALAATASALTAVQTTFRPDRRAKFNQSQQFELAQLASEVEHFRDFDAPETPVGDAKKQLRFFTESYLQVRKRSPE